MRLITVFFIYICIVYDERVYHLFLCCCSWSGLTWWAERMGGRSPWPRTSTCRNTSGTRHYLCRGIFYIIWKGEWKKEKIVSHIKGVKRLKTHHSWLWINFFASYLQQSQVWNPFSGHVRTVFWSTIWYNCRGWFSNLILYGPPGLALASTTALCVDIHSS